ncbi:unnamed protein product, partial [Nesidiocoris tenuis]
MQQVLTQFLAELRFSYRWIRLFKPDRLVRSIFFFKSIAQDKEGINTRRELHARKRWGSRPDVRFMSKRERGSRPD